MAKLKIFFGPFHGYVKDKDGKEYRGCNLLTAQTSQKKAAAVAGCSVGEIRTYYRSGNEKHRGLALKHPGKVILLKDNWEDPNDSIIQIVDHVGVRYGFNYTP